MIKLIEKLYEKYKEIFWYGVFGVITTVVNICLFWLLSDIAGIFYLTANILAWIGAVAVAFVTNKYWVFDSKSWEKEIWIPECIQFICARLITGVLDIFLMYLMVSRFGILKMIAKVLVTILVIIFNYVISKIWIFKKL